MLFKNISYLDLDSQQIVEDVDVLVKGKYIEKIGKDIDASKEEIISGENKLIVPGFANAHSHAGMSVFRNFADDMELKPWLEEKIWPAEAKLTGEIVYWGSLLSMAEMIKSGVTSFCDMYFFMNDVAKAVEETGMKAFLTRGMMDIDPQDRIPEMISLFEEYNGCDDRIYVGPGPHAIYTCSKEYLLKMHDLALKMNGRINIHVSETETEINDSIKNNGTTPLKYLKEIGFLEDLKVIAPHCTHVTDEEIEIMKEYEIFPIYNPTSNLKLASGFTPVKKLLESGIVTGIGTDGDSSNNNQNFMEEIHISAIINKAVEKDPKCVNAVDVLKMATEYGQKALGFEDSGKIKEGYRADFSIFDLTSLNFTPKHNLISALCYSASAGDITDTIVDGKFLMKNRELVNLDEEKIKFNVNKLSKIF